MSLWDDLYGHDPEDNVYVWASELSDREAVMMADDYCAMWMEAGGPVPDLGSRCAKGAYDGTDA